MPVVGQNTDVPLTRRQSVLLSIALGGGTIAGCIGDDEDLDLDDGDDTAAVPDDEEVGDEFVDQSFVLPTEASPVETTLFPNRWFTIPEDWAETYATTDVVAYQAAREPGGFGLWQEEQVFGWGEEGQDYEFGQIRELEFDDDFVRIELKEDLYWSDGEEYTAYDAAASWALAQLQYMTDPPKFIDPDDPTYHDSVLRMFPRIEFPEGQDGNILELYSYHDGWVGEWFENPQAKGNFGRHCIYRGLGTWPTHVSPWDELARATFDELEQGLETHEVTHGEDLIEEYLYEGIREDWRDPENVYTNGAWTLKEFRGEEEIVLEPNEHHRFVRDSTVNFPDVRISWMDEDHRQIAELQAGRPDYSDIVVQPEITNALMEDYELLERPGNHGGAFVFDHSDPVFGQVEVRQAMAYATDQEIIAEMYHPNASVPVETPAGDFFFRREFVGDDWVEENLRSYGQDLEKAAELMETAGFERDGDGNWLQNGEAIQAELPLTRDTPDWEVAVVDQLAEFGIDLTIQGRSVDVFEEEFERGEYRIAGRAIREDRQAEPQIVSGIWSWFAHLILTGGADTYNYLQPENTNEELQSKLEDDDRAWTTILEEDFADAYIEVPPIGEWDAEPEPVYFPEMMVDIAYGRMVADERWDEFVKQSMWIINYWLPTLPFFYEMNQVWLNATDWRWPMDEPLWELIGQAIAPEDYLSSGNYILANPENPT